ncbi:hypothetical protein FIBSPDRAFT_772869 [Athelia psychrophila]|uniref:Mid2 domain-containing protein n=1 Tax=Athelia psychrophila TaxID=1759441 RepID=A0A166WP61_9AGAM|nr:hypothetical protein FIBSPDRAFT_772869 [Fibularhizoctonia sp. CBS 109695]
MLLASLTLIALACLRSVYAQQDVTVPTADPRIVFDGTWVPQDNGGHEFTTTAGSSASLSFIGTQISWHATSNPLGALSRVSVDGASGTLVDASKGTASGDPPVFAVLFSQSGLSPGASHTIRVTQVSSGGLGGPYLEIYNFSSASSVAIAPTTTAQALPSTSSTQSRMQTSVSPAASSSASVATSAPDNDTTTTPTSSSSTAPSSSAPSSVPASLGAATSGNGAIATATSTFLAAAGTATVQQITTVTATANSSLSTSTSPISAIVGGVVGAIALLFILITLFLCWRRKHARNSENIQNPEGPVPVAPLREGAVAPFRDREDIAVRFGPPRLVIPSTLSTEKSNPSALTDFGSAPSPYTDSTPSPATPHAPSSSAHNRMLSESRGALSDRSPHSPRFLSASHIISVLALPIPRSSVPPARSPTPPPPYIS